MSVPSTSEPARPRRGPRGPRRLAVALPAALALGGALGAWGLSSYVRLLRLDVLVADGCARLETAGRERAGLAANMLHACEGLAGLDPRRLQALRAAVERARGQALAPAALVAGGSLVEFAHAHEELDTALAGVWHDLDLAASPASAPRTLDLRQGLEHADALVSAGLTELAAGLAAYHEARDGFPGVIERFVEGCTAQAGLH